VAITEDLLDQLIKDYKKPEDLIGENGLLKQLGKESAPARFGAVDVPEYSPISLEFIPPVPGDDRHC
jgi:hypothetical protein